CVVWVCSVGVGDELAIDRVGDPSLEAAHRFGSGLARGELASEVAAARGVEPDLVGGCDVEQVVDLAVPGPGEPVSDLLAGGGVERGGAGPGREPVAVGKPGDVADVDKDSGSNDRTDPGQVHQCRAAGDDHGFELFGRGLDLLIE